MEKFEGLRCRSTVANSGLFAYQFGGRIFHEILEVNSSPGLEGIERATGRDIAKEIIKYIERGV